MPNVGRSLQGDDNGQDFGDIVDFNVAGVIDMHNVPLSHGARALASSNPSTKGPHDGRCCEYEAGGRCGLGEREREHEALPLTRKIKLCTGSSRFTGARGI
jgi:hypothetical protein